MDLTQEPAPDELLLVIITCVLHCESINSNANSSCLEDHSDGDDEKDE